MNIILADSIDGGIFALLICGIGLLASVVALLGLIPALKGNRVATLVMIFPAVVCGLATTVYCTSGNITSHDPDFDFTDFLPAWMGLAGPSVATSLLTFCVLCHRRTKAKEAGESV